MGYHDNIINKKQKNPQTQSRLKIGDSLITSDTNIICNKFDDVFVNIGPKLDKSLPKFNKSPFSSMEIGWLNLYIRNQLLKNN